jgi:DNA-binding NarL/FixJ family response regulator
MRAVGFRTDVGLPRVLLVDPCPAAREGLALRMEQDRGFQLSGEAGDVLSAAQLVDAVRPDVVVLDVAVKGGSGFDLIKRIRDRYPVVRVLVWSQYKESLYAERVLRTGANGYIQKNHPTVAVVQAVRHVLAGKVYLSSDMTDVMLRQANGKSSDLSEDPITALSDREMEVFQMIAHCRDTQDIAKELRLSLKTVETYRGRIKAKVGVDTSAELLRLAVR